MGKRELDNGELNREGYEIDSQHSDSDGKKSAICCIDCLFPAYF